LSYRISADGKANDAPKITTYDHKGLDDMHADIESEAVLRITYSILKNTKCSSVINSYTQSKGDYRFVKCFYSSQGVIIAEQKAGNEVKLYYFKL
jgi:hypothetical protein